MGPRMPSVIESVFEDFDEGLPEGEVVGVEVWEEAEGVPMGNGTDFRDEEVVKTEVVVELSSTSNTIRSKTAYVPPRGTNNQRPLCVRFSSSTIDEDKAGRSTSAACADIGACVVEAHRLVRQGSAWKC